MKKITRKRNWLYELIVLIELFVICCASYIITQEVTSALITGGVLYYVLAWTLRLTLQRHHRAGMRCLRSEKYSQALSCFERSETFFRRYPWVDRLRPLTMFNSSAYSYLEIALHNQAYALICLERREEAIRVLERLLCVAPERQDVQEIIGVLKEDTVSSREEQRSV